MLEIIKYTQALSKLTQTLQYLPRHHNMTPIISTTLPMTTQVPKPTILILSILHTLMITLFAGGQRLTYHQIHQELDVKEAMMGLPEQHKIEINEAKEEFLEVAIWEKIN